MPFHPLLRRWLAHTARQKLHERMADQQHQADVPPETCDVAVVFALGIEAGGFVDRIDERIALRGRGFTIRLGMFNSRRVAIVISGAGAENAARATEAVLDAHRPQWIVSAGFAGGLKPDISRNDIVMASGVVDPTSRELQIDLSVDPAELEKHPGVHVGRVLTVNRPIRTPEEKTALGEQYDALAVDMETFAVAEVCRKRQVRCLGARIVYDSVDERLPRDIETLLAQPTTATRLGAATAAIFRRPSSIKDMYQLRENALIASERLAAFLAGVVGQLSVMPRETASDS